MILSFQPLQDVREEVQANVASLDNAKGLADKIKELSSEDPSISKDLDDQLQKVEPALNELISALSTRQTELQTALLQSQELKDSLDEFSGWLSAAENRLNLQGPVSARQKVIVDQQDKLQVCSPNATLNSELASRKLKQKALLFEIRQL